MRANRERCGVLLLGFGAAVLACNAPGGSGEVASTDAAVGAQDGPAAIVASLKKIDAFAPQLSSGVRLERVAGGFRARLPERANGWRPVGEQIEVTLPSVAQAPMRVAIRGSDSVWIDVDSADLRPVDGAVVDSALVFRDASPSTDVVHALSANAVEEIRVLRDPAGSPTARYHLAKGPGVGSVRLAEGSRVEVLDREGRVRLRTEPMFAVDAQGTRRSVTLQLDGDTLVASLDTRDLVYPIALDPKWTATGSLAVGRAGHTMTRLQNGKVLVVGGRDSAGNPLTSCELFDRSSGTNGAFTAVAPLSTPRMYHVATLLTDGRVLVVGGATTGWTYVKTAEIYDPVSNSWSSAGTVPTSADREYTLSALPGGAAMVVGGLRDSDGFSVSDWVLFDPSTKTWTKQAGYGAGERHGHAAVTLAGGTVLVLGGTLSDGLDFPLADAMRYEPSTKTWSSAGTMLGAGKPMALALKSGKAFVVAPRTTSAQTWEPTGGAGTWTTVGTVSGTALIDPLELLGGHLFFPGTISTAPRLFDWTSGTTSATAPMLVNHSSSPNVLLTTGEVLVAGGWTDAELYSIGDRGSSCTTSADCTDASPCVDGVCCDSACTGQCQACDNPGSVGTCSAVDGTAPHGSRPACPSPYLVCKSGACATSCTADSDCIATAYCSGGVCLNKKANGAACALAKECSSNHCVDGYCCNAACTGQCQACDLPGKLGTCSTVTSGQPHGSRPACAGSGACQASCDGTSETSCGPFPGTSTVCASPVCGPDPLVSGRYATTPARYCNGTGGCLAASPVSCNEYTCGPTACKTTCTSNTDCVSGYYCSGGVCVSTGASGTACTSGAECSSGYCVDGVCCTTSSCPAPLKCNANGVGTCSKPRGAACSSASECGSGFCVDGVCCDGPCTGKCEACDVGGAEGTCTAVVGAPHGSRGACVGSGVCAAQCNGSDRSACGAPPGGATKCASASCTGGVAIPDAYCDGAGNCETPSPTSCDAYACGPTACKTSCTSNADCASGYYCNGGVCVTTGGLGTVCTSSSQCASGHCVDGVCCATSSCAAPLKCNANGAGTCSKPLGVGCSSDAECGSGVCVDGVCCNTACNGQCEACDVGGNVGTCTAVVGAPHGSREPCSGTGVCAGKCDGSDRTACKAFPGAEQVCMGPSCTGDVAMSDARCNGAGSCGEPTPTSCAPYACGETDCKKLCTSPSDCTTGYTCKSGVCKTTGELGTLCDLDSDCAAGTFCTASEGSTKVCCTVSACGAGEFCAGVSAGASKGTCMKANGSACTSAAECASGACVDGVCCESACEGQCEACDVAGALGKCTAVKGAPHGAREACSDGGSDVCRALSCDGVDRLKCAAFKSGPDVECGKASCVDGIATPAAYCDGAGGCRAAEPRTCAPYVCAGTACGTSCTTDADCSKNNVCEAGKCVPSQSTCTPDELSAIPADKSAPRSCSPFRCNPIVGTCFETCAKSDECAPGFVCDGSTCVPAPNAPTEDSGGCSVGSRSLTSDGTAWGAALAVASLLARRRRSRAW